MKTTLEIPDPLFRKAKSKAAERGQTLKQLVTEALQEYIGRRKQARIAELFGTIDYDPKYDYKKQRRRR